MKELLLKRIHCSEKATFGVLIDDIPFAVTLENPWLENAFNISCIPVGNYLCQKYTSKKFGETYMITGVPDRTGIAFHSGNTSRDTKGCILIGEEFGTLSGEPAILSSRKGFNEFMDRLKDEKTFRLVIVDTD